MLYMWYIPYVHLSDLMPDLVLVWFVYKVSSSKRAHEGCLCKVDNQYDENSNNFPFLKNNILSYLSDFIRS